MRPPSVERTSRDPRPSLVMTAVVFNSNRWTGQSSTSNDDNGAMDIDLQRLQHLLDESACTEGPHLRRTFEPESYAISAEQLARYWLAGVRSIALATVAASGAP